MDHLQCKLMGTLIGLARATDGNEHLITEESTKIISDCLISSPSSHEELDCILERIEAVKRKMVPDCYLCANPCGRTDTYDLSRIDREAPEIRNAKYRILTYLQNLSRKISDPLEARSLYRGLIAIGLEDCSAQELSHII